MGRLNSDKAAGLCLGKPSCYGFSNPSTSELARVFENPSLILLRKVALLWSGQQKERTIQPRITRIYTDEAAGLCLGKPSCDGFSIPFASELARDSKTHRSFCFAK